MFHYFSRSQLPGLSENGFYSAFRERKEGIRTIWRSVMLQYVLNELHSFLDSHLWQLDAIWVGSANYLLRQQKLDVGWVAE